MAWSLWAGLTVVLLFASSLLFGAPFLPTLKPRMRDALDLLDLKPGQTLYELGSGDGRVLKAAAQRGIQAIGYEINPLLVLYSKLYCWPERRLVKIYWRNFWHVTLEPADAVYVFLLNPYMPKLENKIKQEITRPLKVASFAFAFPDRQLSKTKDGMMLYEFMPEIQHASK